jgi:thioredoxin reductase (NADPH)
MNDAHEDLTAAALAAAPQVTSPSAPELQFRSDLTFPRFSDEMLQKLRSYGHEETVPTDTLLYTYGDRDTDMFGVLSGEIESRLRLEGGKSKCFRLLPAGEFTGELNLLNTQRTVALVRATQASQLLRITRESLRLLMRAEGDLANIVVSACIWRRIGMMAIRLRALASGETAVDALLPVYL